MPAESIIDYKKPGFPVIDDGEKGARTTIEYIGPYADLLAAKPGYGATWGTYSGNVTSSQLRPLENGTTGELIVNCELIAGENDGNPTGTLQEINYEINWATVARSYYEHPAFAIGGGGIYALTKADQEAIKVWEKQDNLLLREAYKYLKDPNDEFNFEYLTSNAEKFAVGIEQGQESWDDFAPVARKTSTYVGGRPPVSTEAGEKNTPVGFGGILPSGYEWRKSGDSISKRSGARRYDRTEEWMGAKKVLADKNTIYW